MGFGLDILDKQIEVDKTEWVDYNGTLVPKRKAAALKAWDTRKRNKHYKKYKTISKAEQRRIILDLIEDANKNWKKYNFMRYSGMKKNILVLESPECLFLKEYIKRFEQHSKRYHWPNRIYIPNNIEFDKFGEHTKYCVGCNKSGRITSSHSLKEFKNVYSGTEQVINLLNCSYADLIDSAGWYFNKFSFCMIWADYTGAFSTYSKDIAKTFKSHMLGNHSYFAVTFSKRDPARAKKLKEYSITNCIVAVNDFVSKAAKKYGYDVELLPESNMYKANMYTAIFLVRYKIMDDNKAEIDSIVSEVKEMDKKIDEKMKHLDRIINNISDDKEALIDKGKQSVISDVERAEFNKLDDYSKQLYLLKMIGNIEDGIKQLKTEKNVESKKIEDYKEYVNSLSFDEARLECVKKEIL